MSCRSRRVFSWLPVRGSKKSWRGSSCRNKRGARARAPLDGGDVDASRCFDMDLAGGRVSPDGVAAFLVSVVPFAEDRAVFLNGGTAACFRNGVITFATARRHMAADPFTFVVRDHEPGAGDAGEEAPFADIEGDAFGIDEDTAQRTRQRVGERLGPVERATIDRFTSDGQARYESTLAQLKSLHG